MRVADRSPHSKRSIQRLKQGRVAEWLEQEFNGPLLKRSPADNLVLVSSDEDDSSEPEAYRRDVPKAEVHIVDGGHFALDTAADEIAQLVRGFMSRESAATT